MWRRRFKFGSVMLAGAGWLLAGWPYRVARRWLIRKRVRMRLAIAREWFLHVCWYSWTGLLAEWWEAQLEAAFATGGAMGPEPERPYYRIGEVPCQMGVPVLYLSVPVPLDDIPRGAIVAAPFPLWVQKALQAWQQCGWAHPLTCGTQGCPGRTSIDCEDGGQVHENPTLLVRHYGLECPACDYRQSRVPALCLQLPPDPRTLLGLAGVEGASA